MELADVHLHLRQCRRCLVAGYPIKGPPVFSGRATARLMVVGQAPGKVEVYETCRPFSGSAGGRLFRWLAEAGWDEATFRESCYITSITKCFPGPNASGRGDRAPTRAEQDLCASWLEAEVALVDPAVIVPVGALAVARFLGAGRKLAEVVGVRFQVDGRALIPLPHPSGASGWTQKPEHRRLMQQAIGHLAAVRVDLGL